MVLKNRLDVMRRKAIPSNILLIWLCWLAYACSYMGKLNYAANINQIIGFYNISHSEAGLAHTFFFFAYAIGQVVNGLFCKKYNLKWIIFVSLILGGVLNFAVCISNNFNAVKFLWAINGFSMSVLWPSLIRLLAENVPRKNIPKATVIMSMASAAGTFLIYGASALFVKINFKLAFYLAAILLVAVSFLWLLCFSPIVRKAKLEETEAAVVERHEEVKKDTDYSQSAIFLSAVILGIYGVAAYIIKDGLTTWAPAIMKEQYHLDGSISIILTLALPLVSVFANAFAVKVHKKISDFVLQCAVMFYVAGIILGGVIGSVTLNQFWLTVIGFTLVCFLVSACGSVIASIFPLYMKGKVNSGFMAGILNACCSLGCALNSYCLGAIADNAGWLAVFWTLLAICVATCVIAIIYLAVSKRKKFNNCGNPYK